MAPVAGGERGGGPDRPGDMDTASSARGAKGGFGNITDLKNQN